MRDPTGNGSGGGWGFRSWLIYDQNFPDDGPLVVDHTHEHHETLGEAKAALRTYLSKELALVGGP